MSVSAEAGRGGRVVSVACRPKVEMMRWVFTLFLSFALESVREEIRRSASSAVSCSNCLSAARDSGVLDSVVKSLTEDWERSRGVER